LALSKSREPLFVFGELLPDRRAYKVDAEVIDEVLRIGKAWLIAMP
jgi:hypothetical protein